jgi:hypothetical protein
LAATETYARYYPLEKSYPYGEAARDFSRSYAHVSRRLWRQPKHMRAINSARHIVRINIISFLREVLQIEWEVAKWAEWKAK